MRWLTVIMMAWVGCVGAQDVVPLERFEVEISKEERIEIEVVPVLVLHSSIADATADEVENRIANTLLPQLHKMFGTVHEAMSTLGLGYFQYTLHYGDHIHILVCDEATLYSDQTCVHGDLGTITDLPSFIVDLHDNEPPPKGTVQLNILTLDDKLSWRGVLGVSKWWYWGGNRYLRHWTNRACRAWALQSIQVIAHELGHCFGLIHNEQDTDSGFDLMVSHYAHFDWVKESNKEIVLNHFRYPPPVSATSTATEPIMVNPKL